MGALVKKPAKKKAKVKVKAKVKAKAKAKVKATTGRAAPQGRSRTSKKKSAGSRRAAPQGRSRTSKKAAPKGKAKAAPKAKSKGTRVKTKTRVSSRAKTRVSPKLSPRVKRVLKGETGTGLVSTLPVGAQERGVSRSRFIPAKEEPRYIVSKLAVREDGHVMKRPGPKTPVALVYVYNDGTTEPPEYGEGDLFALDFKRRKKAEFNLFKTKRVGPRAAWSSEPGAEQVHDGKTATMSEQDGVLKGGATSVREMVSQMLAGFKAPTKGKFELKVNWSVYDNATKENVLDGGKTKTFKLDAAKLNKGYRDKLRKLAAFYMRGDKVIGAGSAKLGLASVLKKLEEPKDWKALSWRGAQKVLKLMRELDPEGKQYGHPPNALAAYLEAQLVALSKNRRFVVSDTKKFKRVRVRKGKGKRTYVPVEMKKVPYSEAKLWVNRLGK